VAWLICGWGAEGKHWQAFVQPRSGGVPRADRPAAEFVKQTRDDSGTKESMLAESCAGKFTARIPGAEMVGSYSRRPESDRKPVRRVEGPHTTTTTSCSRRTIVELDHPGPAAGLRTLGFRFSRIFAEDHPHPQSSADPHPQYSGRNTPWRFFARGLDSRPEEVDDLGFVLKAEAFGPGPIALIGTVAGSQPRYEGGGACSFPIAAGEAQRKTAPPALLEEGPKTGRPDRNDGRPGTRRPIGSDPEAGPTSLGAAAGEGFC